MCNLETLEQLDWSPRALLHSKPWQEAVDSGYLLRAAEIVGLSAEVNEAVLSEVLGEAETEEKALENQKTLRDAKMMVHN